MDTEDNKQMSMGHTAYSDKRNGNTFSTGSKVGMDKHDRTLVHSEDIEI